MRMNPTVHLSSKLRYQINPCESLSPFVFTAHALTNGNDGLGIAAVLVSNSSKMGSWQGILGLNLAKAEAEPLCLSWTGN